MYLYTRPVGSVVYSAGRVTSQTKIRQHVRAVFRRRTRSGTVQTAHRVFDARRVISPTYSARAAMRAWASTRRMVGSAWTARLERSHQVCLGQLAAQAAATSGPCISRTRGESVAHALLASSRMSNDTSVWTVVWGSTAMAACVRRVLPGLSQRTIRVAAICAWHSARTSTAPMEWRAQRAVQGASRSPTAQDVRPALLWAMHTCLRQAIRACSAVLAASRMLR